MVVGNRRERHREEFAELLRLPHVLNNLRDEGVILIFGILLVEDTELFLLEPHAAEAVVASLAHPAVEEVTIIAPAVEGEDDGAITDAALSGFVEEFAVFAEKGEVLTGLHGSVEAEAVFHVFTVFDEEAPRDVLGIEDVVPFGGFRIVDDAGGTRMGFPEFCASAYHRFSCLPG